MLGMIVFRKDSKNAKKTFLDEGIEIEELCEN